MGCFVSKAEYRLIEQQLEEAKKKNRQLYTSLNTEITNKNQEIEKLNLSLYSQRSKNEELSRNVQTCKQELKQKHEIIQTLQIQNQDYLRKSIISQQEQQQETERMVKENQMLIEKTKNYDDFIKKLLWEIQDAKELVQAARNEAQKAQESSKVEEIKRTEDKCKQLEEKISHLMNDKENMETEWRNLMLEITTLQQENQILSQYVPQQQDLTLRRYMSTKGTLEEYQPPTIKIVLSSFEQNGANCQQSAQEVQE